MNIMEQSLEKHYEWNGKIEVISRLKINSRSELSLAYTPGVAEPCLAIAREPELSFKLTRRNNLVAVVTDGSAVLGLGDIGAVAAMPVMEGKCALFKEFADVDAFPICIDSRDTDEIVRTVQLIAGSFGGINLEDISAPRCFEVERKLKELNLGIPVFHDDQHGTAIVCGAAMINAAKLAEKEISDLTLVINGAGAAGIAIAKIFLNMGVGNLILVDIDGIICDGDSLPPVHAEMSKITNKNHIRGCLADALKGSDAFIGVSKPNLVTAEMIKSMNEKSIVFAMANPTPEIMPDIAHEAGAFIVGTGRSDYPNQINNVLAFPGIFKGALQVRAENITEEMKLAAAYALADSVGDKLNVNFILPDAFDRSVPSIIANAVSKVYNK